jgi:beta-glucanase (GH16 family)
VPAPVCESKNYQFNNLNGIVPNTQYLGDASKADWVSSGTPLSYNNAVLLTMSEGTVGTLLASTHYLWYGKVTAKFMTSAGAGVVTAFILLSDVKDEIDFEFVGVELTTAQTNFYSQGIPNCESILDCFFAANSLTNQRRCEWNECNCVERCPPE